MTPHRLDDLTDDAATTRRFEAQTDPDVTSIYDLSGASSRHWERAAHRRQVRMQGPRIRS